MHQRLYQYNEDDFSISVLTSNKLFTNYKFASKQREAVNWQLFLASIFMGIQSCFKAWKKISKIKIEVVVIVLIYTRTTL